jgi:peptide/nickel transport system permease protein
MRKFLIRRTAMMVLTLLFVSAVVFLLIELPPGDFAERQAFKRAAAGEIITEGDVHDLKVRYGLDQPFLTRYARWASGIVLRGDFGISFQYQMPVTQVIGDRLALTLVIAICSLVLIYAIAVPVGVFAAVKQYSLGDFLASSLCYVGLAVPNFMLALFLMYMGVKVFGTSVGGLFSPAFVGAPWSLSKLRDLLGHLWVPCVVLTVTGTAFQTRTVRATLLDELNKLYVKVARSKGLSEWQVLTRYPVRVAINPIVSTLGWELTNIISNSAVISVVLSLSDTGSLLIKSLIDQDMYLAGAILLMLSFFTILGTFLSDVLLAILDPRVRLGRGVE